MIILINRNIRLHITSIYINTKYIYKCITPKTLYIDRNTQKIKKYFRIL